MSSRILFSGGSVFLHELHGGILFYKYWFLKLHNLYSRILFDNN